MINKSVNTSARPGLNVSERHFRQVNIVPYKETLFTHWKLDTADLFSWVHQKTELGHACGIVEGFMSKQGGLTWPEQTDGHKDTDINITLMHKHTNRRTDKQTDRQTASLIDWLTGGHGAEGINLGGHKMNNANLRATPNGLQATLSSGVYLASEPNGLVSFWVDVLRVHSQSAQSLFDAVFLVFQQRLPSNKVCPLEAHKHRRYSPNF